MADNRFRFGGADGQAHAYKADQAGQADQAGHGAYLQLGAAAHETYRKCRK